MYKLTCSCLNGVLIGEVLVLTYLGVTLTSGLLIINNFMCSPSVVRMGEGSTGTGPRRTGMRSRLPWRADSGRALLWSLSDFL